MHTTPTDPSVPIELITSNEELILAVEQLKHCSQIAIDTEYDSFQRHYGFTLLLIQIWDGKKIYLIDPLRIKDLSPLWTIIGDQEICKVLYSGSEDIALLKQSGSEIKNIYDVQIAATLCNTAERNLGELMESETGIPLNKKQQTSDWSIRPLTDEQVEYAANDVLHLLTIKEKLNQLVDQRGLTDVLLEENAALEKITPREHVPRLKPIYYNTHTKSFCETFLALLEWRDRIARSMNLSPVRVVDTRHIEDALNNKTRFLSDREFAGFNPKIKNSPALQAEFIKILQQYDPTDPTRFPRERTMRNPSMSKMEKEEMMRTKYEPVQQELLNKYGERTTEYLLRGLKKVLVSENSEEQEIREYQRRLIDRMKSIQS